MNCNPPFSVKSAESLKSEVFSEIHSRNEALSHSIHKVMIEEGSEELTQTEIKDHFHKKVGAFYPDYDVEPNQEAYL
jgi:hypothetical protein